jgi:hypothetical protein
MLREANLFLDVLRNVLSSHSAAVLLIEAGHPPSQVSTSPSLLGLMLVSIAPVHRVTAPAYQLQLPLVACLRSGRI